ncbi:MAG: hypothetical protein IJV27_01195 [Prevotella sp.]|nr:hypothetical protein [Prevotella sp.]
MKRLLFLVASLSCFTFMTAKNGITLKSGNLSVFAQSAKASIVFDYSKAGIEGKDISVEDYIDQKGPKFSEKWKAGLKTAKALFIKRFNKKSPGLQLTGSKDKDVKYQIIVYVSSVNMGNTVKSALPVGVKTDGGAVLFGKIEVKDAKKASLCTLKLTDIQGLGQFNVQARMYSVYQELCNALLKTIKKEDSSKSGKADSEGEEEEDDE